MFSFAFAKFAVPFLMLAAAFGFNVQKDHGKQSDIGTTTTQAEVVTQINSRDTSNVSLDADMSAIDSQMQLLGKSNASIDASFSDNGEGNKQLEQDNK
jgi:hypothetical protein